METKKAYVIVFVNGKKQIWPYPEAQEYCLYDLSDSVIYLTDFELSKMLPSLLD